MNVLVWALVLGSSAVALAQWEETGSLIVGRAGHTATVLVTGKVLVAGGLSGSAGRLACSASAEVYDPVTGLWTATAPMTATRCHHTATLLDDGSGHVFVTGGVDAAGTTLASTEFYNPVNNSWTSDARDDMGVARSHHAAVLVGRGGDVLVSGGMDGVRYLNSAEQYSIERISGSWNQIDDLKTARAMHTMTRLLSDRIVVAGGTTSGGVPTDTAEYCSSSAYCTWVYTTNNLAVPRTLHTATALDTGDLLISGGLSTNGIPTNATELYDNTRFNEIRTTLTTPRFNHAAVRLLDGSVMAVGGIDDTGGYIDSIEIYQPGTRRWARGGLGSALGTARASFTASLLTDGRVLVAGGESARSAASNSAEIY